MHEKLRASPSNGWARAAFRRKWDAKGHGHALKRRFDSDSATFLADHAGLPHSFAFVH